MSRKNLKAKAQGLIKTWLGKLDIKSIDELTIEERQSYDEWNNLLNSELTLEKLAEALRNESELLNVELREATQKGDNRKALFVSARLENYAKIIAYIEEPEREKEALIEHITSLLESN